MNPQPKFAYVRSPALMRAYRTLRCARCLVDDGTICGAHSNWAVHGKGKGIKATDIRCASLCSECHLDIDQGSRLSEAERKAEWWNAHIQTVHWLLRQGAWPHGVPVPETSVYPFS
jgi:hypothetical protein